MNLINSVAFVSGIHSHLLYFKYGEHHERGTLYMYLATVVPLLSIMVFVYLKTSVRDAVIVVLPFYAAYFLGLYISMVFYRISPFHRLHAFPGPFSYRVSKLFHAFDNGKSQFKSYKNLHEMHERYGNFVRTGPSELSIIDPETVEAIFAPNSECTRAAWYCMADPIKAIFHTRDRAEHDKRRVLWSQGLSTKSLRAYEERIQTHIARLVRHMSSSAANHRPLDVSLWFNYLSFDIMGEVGFGQSFDMLEKAEKPHVLKILENGQQGLGIFGVVPWLFMILTKIPWISAEHDIFVQWCQKQMMERKERVSSVPDIASALIVHDAQAADKETSHKWIVGDSRILIVAGSDAVASSLVFAFYHLARFPDHVDSIRREIERISGSISVLPNAAELQNRAPVLNAFITEVLRLWPPNPSGVLRQTPAAGLTVGQRYIPGNITVCTPFWTLHRSEKCFIQPQEFLPERWLDSSELVLQKRAYMPFGQGVYACIGKQLALMEMRLVIAKLVQSFDVRFADSENGERLFLESKDWFTWGLPPMMLQFRKREA